MNNLDILLEGTSINVADFDLFSESATIIAVADYEYDIFQESAKNVAGDIIAWIKKMFNKIREIVLRLINDIKQGNIMLKKRFEDAKSKNKMDKQSEKEISTKTGRSHNLVRAAEITPASIEKAIVAVHNGDGKGDGLNRRDQYVDKWLSGTARVILIFTNSGDSITTNLQKLDHKKNKKALSLEDANAFVTRADLALKELDKLTELTKTLKTAEDKALKESSKNEKEARKLSVAYATTYPAIITLKKQVCVQMVLDGIKVLHKYK